MACKVIYDPDEDCVHATVKGEVDLAMVHRYAKEIIEQLNAHNCRHLLNDMREASVKLSTVDIYDLPAWVEEAGMSLSGQRALLVSRNFNDYKSFETVARNHGHLVEVFTDSNKTGIFRERATVREWLGLMPAKPASGRKRPASALAKAEDRERRQRVGCAVHTVLSAWRLTGQCEKVECSLFFSRRSDAAWAEPNRQARKKNRDFPSAARTQFGRGGEST